MRKVLSRWHIALYLASIFCAGAISGWMVAAKTVKERMFSPPRPDEVAAFWRNRLQAELNLSPEQAGKIEDILLDSTKEVDALRGQWLQGIRQAISNRNIRISALLSPEQNQQFERIERERQEKARRKDFRRHRGFPSRGRHNEHPNPEDSKASLHEPTNPPHQEPSPE